MEIQITQTQCGGTQFQALPHRLHLGAQHAAGVDRLQFILPDAWAGCSLALYLRRGDGTQLAPIPLDGSNSVTVDRRLTGCTGGQWMLAAVRGTDYTAYTRPGSYDTYATLPTDGGSEELPPSQYEQFVARVLESARAAADSAQKAAANAEDTARQAALAQSAADKILADRTDAAACAERAEAAALRAESIAPTDGMVLSVNGKGGVVRLTAQDVSALPRPALPRPGEVVRILSVDSATGALKADTTPLPDLQPYLRSDTVPSAEQPGAVRADSRYGVAVRSDATLTTVPATQAQLDAMTEPYAPLTPALLPYGVKKALTSAAGAAGWTEEEQAAALQQLGADRRFYSREEADRKFGTGYILPAATAATLGGVKVGTGLTVSTDGTLELTAENINTALGYVLAERLDKLERKMNMDGKLIYTATGTAGNTAVTLTVPDAVDYIEVKQMTAACMSSTEGDVAVAKDFGTTRIARGGTAVAMVGGPAADSYSSIKCNAWLPTAVTFGTNGTVTIAAATSNGGLEMPFNVEGYQYL